MQRAIRFINFENVAAIPREPEYDGPQWPRDGYVNTGPEHMPLGLADRKAHDARLAERGERDES